MKLIHTADWHLGKTLHKLSLEDFQASFLDHLFELTRAEQPDAILLAGDVYDRAIPPTTSIHLLEDTLQRLTELTRVVVIPGNHDSAPRLGFGSKLFTERLRIVSETTAVGKPVVIASGDEVVNVYPVPYLEPDIARITLADEVDDEGVLTSLARSHQAVMEAALRRIDADLAVREGAGIAMIHAFIAGSATSDSERDISVGGSQSINPSVFQALGAETRASRGLSYVAAGHLHRPQQFETGGPIVRYSGSPLPFSFSEASDKKSTTIVNIEGTRVELEQVPVPQPYSLHQVRGTIEQLTSDVPEWATTGFAHVEVTDLTRPEHLHERIKAHYPNALLIRHTPPASKIEAVTPSVEKKSPEELSLEFFELALGRGVDAREAEIIEQAWATVLQEAK
ncbi:MAG: exonuclease SbcCD subunit D [Actinomycetaceae bacterium]|nr:exonuclease SbcCD subunit D [Actinomycetaceae bacterium]